MKGFIFYICHSTHNMKQLLVIILTLTSINFARAQKNFEGTITYRLHASTGDKPDAELKVLFGQKKIKLMFKEKEEYDQDALIVNLDSATVYNVNFEDKTFRRNILVLSNPAQKPARTNINGYTVSAFQPESTGLGSLLGGMRGTSKVTFYLADSLHYFIPAAFAGNKELLIVQKNRIVLGAEIELNNVFSDSFGEFSDSVKNNNLITAEAVEIKTGQVDENEFIIPADFTDRKDWIDPVTVDTAAFAVDTAVIITPQKVEKKKKPVKPAAPKSKTAGTGKAIKPKE